MTENRTYSLIKDSFNTTNNYLVYNPITNNYTEINNISYNQQYDTYNITNNEYNYYITNNYTYYSYYIVNNETGEDSYCELYYEMPDGRNSYNLEVSDVWGEYFVYDVQGYESVVEDDGKTLALYHFNNNVSDSSYWKNSDFPLISGLYNEAKFGSGLIVNTDKNTKINYDLPLGFNVDNFTLEFTVISYGGYTNDYLSFSDGVKTYLLVDILSSSGIYNFVIQNNSGSVSFYCNGSKMSFTTWNNVNDSLAFIYLTSEYIQIRGNNNSYILDELRISNCALYSGDSISVMNQEFDTNQVLCLPSSFSENTIAVQGSLPVNGYRVGGVRPTYPNNGFVYIFLENDIVKDIQQFQNDGWYSVNATIRRNNEWVELKECNLSDLTIDKIPEIPPNIGGDSGDSDSGGSVSDNNTGTSSGSGLSGFLDGLGALGDALLAIIGKLLEYVGKAIELLSGTVTKVIDLVPQNITNLISGLFPFIPQEWLVAIELSLVLAVVIGIVGIFKK